jgi:hypothetical protein
MSKKTIGIALLAFFVGAMGVYWYTHKSPSFPHTVIETGDRQYKESADYYTVQINYPDKTPLATRTSAGADRKALATTESMLKGLVSGFKDLANVGALSQEEKDRLNQNGLKYSLNVGYRPYSSGSFVSYEYDVYMDTGGAHPNNSYKTLVFDLNGNTVKLGDLFMSGDYLTKISEMAKTQIEAQITQRAGKEAVSTLVVEGYAPKAENFENFVVDSDRIRIFIPPYQVAAYAAGGFEVQIPLAEMKDILKPNVK